VSASKPHQLFQQIESDFDKLLVHLEQAIEALADDEGGSFALPRLQRARQAARRGAELARSALLDQER
jgi:hypothetical protein